MNFLKEGRQIRNLGWKALKQSHYLMGTMIQLRMKIVGGLMKGEAHVWYSGLGVVADWDTLKKEFLKEWREEGAEAKAFSRLNLVLMRKCGSLRSYMQKVQKLVKMITPAPPAKLIMEWFIQGLYPNLNKYVRKAKPATIQDAHEMAQAYIDSNMSQCKQLARELKKESEKRKKKRKRSRKTKGKGLKSYSSSSSDSVSESSSSQTDSEDESSSLDSEAERGLSKVAK
jgi:hypothetical protein